MPKTLAEVSRDAAQLPERDRLKLVHILLELSEEELEPSAEVEAAWENEIERRLTELRSGAVKGVPLAEVKEKIEKRFSS